jgi:anti-sigma factor (TIGR02949 family)
VAVPTGCREAVERLWDYLDGRLDVGTHEAMEAHLAFCRRCCGELEFARELHRLLRSRSAVEVPDEARARLERVIDGLADANGSGAFP